MLDITVYHPIISLHECTISVLDYLYDEFNVSTLIEVCLVTLEEREGFNIAGVIITGAVLAVIELDSTLSVPVFPKFLSFFK